jgi:hypothetical protein
MPATARSAPWIHHRPTLRPCGLPWIPAFAGRTAREAPTSHRVMPATLAPTSPQRHAGDGRHPRQATPAMFIQFATSPGASDAGSRVRAARTPGMWSCGPRATSPGAEGDPGPRALVSCGRGRPRSAFSQRHADEGKKRPLHPRQANASALRPTVDPGLRREDGERGARLDRGPHPRTRSDPGPRPLLTAREDARGPDGVTKSPSPD